MSYFVYKHWDKDGVLLYVGCCKDLTQRTNGHASSAWFYGIANITSEEFPDKKSALAEEKKAIKEGKPLYNIMHHPNRKTLMKPLPEPPEHIAKNAHGGYTIHYVRYFISKLCFDFGGVIKWSEANDIAWSYVYGVIRGAQEPCEMILKKIGFEARLVEILPSLNPMADACYD